MLEQAEQRLGLGRQATRTGRQHPRRDRLVEGSEDRAGHQVRRDVGAEGAPLDAFGDDIEQQLQVGGHLPLGDPAQEPTGVSQLDLEDEGEVTVALEAGQVAFDHGAELVARVGVPIGVAPRPHQELLGVLFEDGDEQVLLAGEVEVQRAVRDARTLCDLAHARREVPPLGEHSHRGSDDLRTPAQLDLIVVRSGHGPPERSFIQSHRHPNACQATCGASMPGMDSALDGFVGGLHLLAPAPGATVLLRSGPGPERTGTLVPLLQEALAEAVRTGHAQHVVFRDKDGSERNLRVFTATGLEGQALAVDSELEQSLLAPAIENMVNQIAHDVRNYSFTIGLQAEMGLRRAGAASEVKGHFDAVLRQIDALKHYLEQLLIFGRAPSLAPTSLDPVALLRDLLHRYQFSRPADAAPLSVRIEAASAPETVRWDSRAVSAALLALLDNAVHSATPPPAITLVVARHGEQVVIEVRDSGPGIAPEALALLDVPMAVRRAGGAGLGLAIARKLAAAHGGRLVLESSPSGTVARIELPAEVGAV